MVGQMGKISIWYSKNHILRGIAKSIGLSGLDYFLIEKSKEAIKEIHNIAVENIDSYIKIINNSVEIGSKLTIVSAPDRPEAKFVSEGLLRLTDEEIALENQIVSDFPENWSNDPCGVLTKKPNWQDIPLIIRYKTLSFGGVLARRKKGLYAGVISANVILFCEEEKSILVHRRSSTQNDYPNALHTYGGAFIPPGSDPREDHSGIKRTALREIMEEADIGVHIPRSTPKIVIDEHEIQFIQTAFIGVNLTSAQLIEAESNWEGDPVIIKFDQLYEKANDLSFWTPTGWVHLIMWLALSCPGSSSILKFKGATSVELLENLTKKCLTSCST